MLRMSPPGPQQFRFPLQPELLLCGGPRPARPGQRAATPLPEDGAATLALKHCPRHCLAEEGRPGQARAFTSRAPAHKTQGPGGPQ